MKLFRPTLLKLVKGIHTYLKTTWHLLPSVKKSNNLQSSFSNHLMIRFKFAGNQQDN